MSAEQEQQQAEAPAEQQQLHDEMHTAQQQQPVPEDAYSSSDEDEWLRPSADAIKKADEQKQQQDEQQPKKDYSWDEDEKGLAGDDVLVSFSIQCDGGETKTLPPKRFVMGQTIAHLKTFLEDCHGIGYTTQTMMLGDQPLIDPLSLNDLSFKAGEENLVTVIVSK